MPDNLMEEIKAENHELLLSQGFEVNDWLPPLSDLEVRNLEDLKGRMSVMTALINIAFQAPVPVIKNWIQKNELNSWLSEWESLWALMWVTKLIDAIPAPQSIGMGMQEHHRLGRCTDGYMRGLYYSTI